MTVEDTLELLIEIQGQVLQYRRLAESGRFDASIKKLIHQLADEVEAKAREVDLTGDD